jgi:phosphate uptake regulator
MQRSVIRLAGKTFVVSLPSKWCKANGVTKGALLEVTPHGRTLLVGSQGPSHDKLKLAYDGHADGIKPLLTSAYKRGYDEIELGIGPGMMRQIQRTIDEELVGFEIINQGKSHCTIRTVTDEREEEYDQIMQRCVHILGDMLESGLSALKSKKWAELEESALSERTLDKLTNFAKRVLNKKFSGDADFAFNYGILRGIEQTSDVLENTYVTWAKAGHATHDEIVLFEDVCKYAKTQLALIQSRSLTHPSSGKKILLMQAAVLIEKGGHGAIIGHHLSEAINALDNMAGQVIGLSLGQTATSKDNP